MFGIFNKFKKQKEEQPAVESKEEIVEESVEETVKVEESKEVQELPAVVEETIEEEKEERKGFFAKALEKTVDNFKSIIPAKKEKTKHKVFSFLLSSYKRENLSVLYPPIKLRAL